MNRDQKATTIAEIATQIDESHAIFAVDYRGITVSQVAELRTKLRAADASFKVVKNSLTERAADQTGAETLKTLLAGPTALTFVRGDIATAAKAIADYARVTQLLPFKGGLMDGAALDAEQIRSISRLPSRDVLYGQLVGVVASPVSGLVRTLSALVSGLAVALGQVQAKKESGELPAGDPPAAARAVAAEETPAAEEAREAEKAPEAEKALEAEKAPDAEKAPAAETPAEEPAEDASAEAVQASAEDAPAQEAAVEETPAEAPTKDQAEPEKEPAQDDNQADASAQQAKSADANPKED